MGIVRVHNDNAMAHCSSLQPSDALVPSPPWRPPSRAAGEPDGRRRRRPITWHVVQPPLVRRPITWHVVQDSPVVVCSLDQQHGTIAGTMMLIAAPSLQPQW